ncbi:MAG TPA: VOC family protein [Solirubrobacterales bacterium]
MVHHVAIEVRPADVERMVELFELLGFKQVDPPPSLAEFTWLERGGTQVHLLPTEPPTVPPTGHVAVTLSNSHSRADSDQTRALDFDEVVARMRAAGFEVERRGEHWGSPRAKVTAPGGHTVEVMGSPPDRTVD